jgi:acetolactate synthase-1/2/3 large subunit
MMDIVPKVWGYEWVAFDNGKAAITILHIAKGSKTSLHCHPKKETRLIVLSGSVEFTDQWSRLRPPYYKRVMRAMDIETIQKGIYHQSEAVLDLAIPSAEDGAWLMEIEEPSDKTDLLRAEDEYGRAGMPYETEVVPYSGEILQLEYGNESSFMGYRIGFGAGSVDDADKQGIITTVAGMPFHIVKDSTMKLSDYVADFIAGAGIKHVFSVAGGGSMHLVDSIGKHRMLKYVACHHEQAAAMAAEASSRLTGLGCCLVTTGPGGTNAVTGLACAWVDSIPVLFISGQVTTDTMLGVSGLRQLGVQETDIIDLVTPLVKYAATVYDERDIRMHLEAAQTIATRGRPGPVWIDIPLDLQSKQIDPGVLERFHADPPEPTSATFAIEECMRLLRDSQRPVMIVGNGVRLSGAAHRLLELLPLLPIPVVSSWTGSDMLGDCPLHIGHCGIFGDRASNFVVQNADMLLVIGCRLSIPQIGYNREAFARDAEIIMVDIDVAEIEKFGKRIALPIIADASTFIDDMLEQDLPALSDAQQDWLERCLAWKEQYPVVLPKYANEKHGVNSYYFVKVLCEHLPDDAVVVTDMGTAFTGTFQAAQMKIGQRWITASGHAPMGYGLPGAIGAAFATGKPVVCIVGDGALQFNIQELATIAHHRLPITIFVLNNGGYLTIKHMQSNHFERYVGSEKADLRFPAVMAIGGAYNIFHHYMASTENLLDRLGNILDARGPTLVEIIMPPDQPLIPRVASKKLPDGSIRSTPIEDMWPYLTREEFKTQMIVPIKETLS